ncbi:mannose-1-phosphate guanylyltransferase [Litoreibacter roseus]|nr:sugar phosphate nucleotidyltransferase [Litoreibacter roseus]
MSKIYPIILCGGSGSRLWPMSRSGEPKQFQSVTGVDDLSLFQATVQRHRSAKFADPVIVTNLKHTRRVAQQLQEIQCKGTIISEPVGRNTGPAVLAAALTILKSDPDAIMLVLPSDHVIQGDVNTSVVEMTQAAIDGRIITFGIKPRYPEPGFGYITDGGRFVNYSGLHRVDAFIEKPPLSVAQSLVSLGKAYWASGISMFSAATIVEEYRKYDPATTTAVSLAVEDAIENDYGPILEKVAFSAAKDLPTESAVFEKSAAVALTPLDITWSDVGSWSAVHDVVAKSDDGNVLHGDVHVVDTTNSLIRSEDRLVTVVGLSNIIVVDTPDAVLVTSHEKCQDIKTLVNNLKVEDRRETVEHARRTYSWGESRRIGATQSCEMTIVRLKSGFSIDLDAVQGTQIINVSGKFAINGSAASRDLAVGDQFTSESVGNMRLSNSGDDMGEALIVRYRTDQSATASGQIAVAS